MIITLFLPERGGATDEEQDRRLRNRVEFPDEPMRQARFKEFLHYLRRGLPYPQPTDLTVWEWEWEKKEFESKLTSEERGMLPEVQSRSQPLAKTAIAAPIFEAMASKFVKEAAGDLKVGTKDEDKLAAIKMEMFGEKTRMSFEWYPDSLLCKRFNVPHPYPGAEMIGVPALQKNNFRKKDTLAEIGGVAAGIGLPNTANEIQMRERLLKSRAQREANDKKSNDSDEEKQYPDAEKENESDSDSDTENEAQKEEKAPKSFFDFIFGGDPGTSSSSENEEEDSEDEENERKQVLKRNEERLRKKKEDDEKKEEEERSRNAKEMKELKRKEEKRKKEENVKKQEDEDDDIQVIEETKKTPSSYGPSLPPVKTFTSESVLKFLQEDLKKKKDKKKEKKEKKKSKKTHKKSSKKSKKEKRRRSSSDESSTDEEWEEKRK
uniref:Uncharacterized protein n=1 Tax=Caenorhabditis japonica TaxID=281687 RepID=A0A8R1I0T7_CAEJA